MACGVLIAIGFVILLSREPATAEQDPPDITINIPAFHGYGTSGNGRQLDVSRDGKRIVYAGSVRDGSYRLFVQTIGEPEPVEIPGTVVDNRALRDPTFSPDGLYVAYSAKGEVKKTTLDGTSVSVIGKATTTRGIAWLDSDTLLLGNPDGPLLKLSALEKTPVPLAESIGPSLPHVGPHVLPGNKTALLTIAGESVVNARIAVVNLETGEERQLFDENAFAPRYLPSGHIVFGRGFNRQLMAVRFDLSKLEIIGSAQPVLKIPLLGNGNGGATDYSVSDTGVLVYTPRLDDGPVDALAWIGGITDTEIHVRLNWFEELKRLVP
jgi:hypothetical protein